MNDFNEINTKLIELIKKEKDQAFEIETLKDKREKELDKLMCDLLAVLDLFTNSDTRLQEIYPEDEGVKNARKRFASARKKIETILEINQVKEIEFPGGKSTLNDCQIVDTEPDKSKENDTIVRIEKAGYRRGDRLLRPAELVIVKN